MELANLAYRSSGDRGGTMSDSEMSTGRRRNRIIPDNTGGRSSTMHHDQHRNLPIYLMEPGRLPGIPKGRKVRKRRPHNPGNAKSSSVGNVAGAKSFDIIDTNRTDISKMSSEFHVGDFIDTNRTLGTEGSDLDYQHFLPYHHQLLPGPAPYTRTTPLYPGGETYSAAANITTSSAADARFPELNPLTPMNANATTTATTTTATNNNSSAGAASTLKIAHGYGHSEQASPYLKAGTGASNPASLTPGRWAQNELALPLGRSPVKGVRRGLAEPRPPDSAPSLDQSPSRLKQNRPNKSSQCKRSSAMMENMDYEPNPEVVPFQPANFIRHHSVLPLPVIRSSTILKRVPIPKRHQDTFGGYEYNFIGKRGVMLHTDRYQIDFIKSLDGMTQRERLQAGFDYMEAMRGTRRRREMVPHRAQLDLIMGGKQIEFEERFDITREIQKLKSIAMPKHAKDLFHGRGIHLPTNHLSLHPRFAAQLEDEEFLIPSQATMPSIPRRGQAPPPSTATSGDFPSATDTNFLVNGGQSMLFRVNNGLRKHRPLPTIRGKSDTGRRVFSEPISLARERHEVNKLSARLGLLSRLNRDVTSLSKSTAQAPTTSRDPTWQADQKLIARGLSDKTAPVKPGAPRPAVPDTHVPVAETAESKGSVGSHLGEHTAEAVAASAPPTQIETTPLVVPSADAVMPRIEVTSSDSKTRPRTEESASASVTPHPLRATALITSVPPEEQDALRQTFQRLDTDADGHLKYNQLKTQLPKKFTREQERFTEEVYNLTNSITFFGVDEFMVMNRLSQCVESLTGRAAEAFETLDFTVLAQHLLKYIGMFDTMDKGNTGKISLDSLQKILSDTVSPMLISDSALWDEALDSISADFSSEVSKVVFIAHIPLFLSLETAFK